MIKYTHKGVNMKTEFDEELYESKMQYVRQLLDEIEAKERARELGELGTEEESVEELSALIEKSKLALAQGRESDYSAKDRFYLFRNSDDRDVGEISPEKEKALIMHSQIPNTVRKPELELYLALISPFDIDEAREKIKNVRNLNFKVYNEPMIEFCFRHGNMPGIELLIDKGYDLMQINPKLLSKILYIEITRKREKYYDALLNAEADVNYQTANGRTLLGYALKNDDAVLGQKLLDRGAKVRDDAELWYAIMERKFKFAKMLVENGEKINRYVKYWAKYEGGQSIEGREFKNFLIEYLRQNSALDEAFTVSTDAEETDGFVDYSEADERE